METEITAIYCLCDDVVTTYSKPDDPQVQMTTAEVMTTALTAALYYGGNIERSATFLKEHGYMPNMLGTSRLNRRLHRIEDSLWLTLFALIAEVHKHSNTSNEYIMDSFPIPVCDNIRIRRCKLYQGEDHRGYIPSKRRYFYGLRVTMLVTVDGNPVEFIISPGRAADGTVVKALEFDVPDMAVIYADKGYTDYGFEDFLASVGITLKSLRKKNSKRAVEPYEQFVRQRRRKQVETTFSTVTNLFPKSIHAVTAKGFELKVILFIIAFTISVLS